MATVSLIFIVLESGSIYLQYFLNSFIFRGSLLLQLGADDLQLSDTCFLRDHVLKSNRIIFNDNNLNRAEMVNEELKIPTCQISFTNSNKIDDNALSVKNYSERIL